MGDVVSGITDTLFGSSSDAKQVGSASTLTKAQRVLLKDLSNMLGGQLGQGVAPYGGEVSPGASGLQTQAWDEISKLLSGGFQPSDTATGATQSAVQALNQVLGGGSNVAGPTQAGDMNAAGPTAAQRVDVGEYDPTAAKEWWKDSVVNPAMSQYTEEILPGIKEHFISQNAGSSSGANRAIAKSSSDLMGDLTGILADKISQERTDHTNRGFTADMNAANQNFTAGENFAGRTDDIGKLMQSLNFQGGESFADRLFRGSNADLDRTGNVASQFLDVAKTDTGMNSQSIDDLLRSLNLSGGMGAQQRGVEADQNQDAFSKWFSSQGYNNPWLNLLPSALGTTAVSPIVQGPSQTNGLIGDLADMFKFSFNR